MIQSNPALPFSEVAVVHTSDPKSGVYQGDSSLYEFDFFLVFSLLLLSEKTFSHVLCWQIRAPKRKRKEKKKKKQATNIDLFCSCCNNLEPILICFHHFLVMSDAFKRCLWYFVHFLHLNYVKNGYPSQFLMFTYA